MPSSKEKNRRYENNFLTTLEKITKEIFRKDMIHRTKISGASCLTPEYLLTATSLSPCFFAVESNPFLGGGSPRGESERRGRFLQHERHKKQEHHATVVAASAVCHEEVHTGNGRVSLFTRHECYTKT